MIDSVLISLLPTWILFIVACTSPGQNTVLMISSALSGSRSSMAMTALGLAIGGFIWSFFSLLGAHLLFAQIPSLIRFVAFLGGAYLMYIGIKSFITALAKYKINGMKSIPSEQVLDQFHVSYLKSIQIGLITTLTNPKVALLWVSMSPLVPIRPEQVFLLTLYSTVIALIVFVIYGGIGYLFTTKLSRNVYSANENLFNFIFGVVFIAIGLSLIIYHAL